MPTYTTPNSTQTYTVPSGVDRIYAIVNGAQGGRGADRYSGFETSGGAGGRAVVTRDVSPGDELTVVLGAPGADGDSGTDSSAGSGGVGGASPWTPGSDGAAGQSDPDGNPNASGGGGGGGLSGLAVGGSHILEVGGGGGGGGSNGVDTEDGYILNGGGGGGGGGPGGAGGSGEGDASTNPATNGGGGGVTATSGEFAAVTTTQGGSPGLSVEISPIPPAPADLAVLPAASSIDLSWTDGDYETNYRIYVDGSVVATRDANTESHTITGLTEGTTYQIGVEAYQSDADAGRASTTTATTVLPRPTGLEVVETRLREVDLAWTLHSTDETRIDVLTSTDDGASWSVAQQLSPGTESATLTGLLDGTDYQFGLEVIGQDVTERREFY